MVKILYLRKNENIKKNPTLVYIIAYITISNNCYFYDWRLFIFRGLFDRNAFKLIYCFNYWIVLAYNIFIAKT